MFRKYTVMPAMFLHGAAFPIPLILNVASTKDRWYIGRYQSRYLPHKNRIYTSFHWSFVEILSNHFDALVKEALLCRIGCQYGIALFVEATPLLSPIPVILRWSNNYLCWKFLELIAQRALARVLPHAVAAPNRHDEQMFFVESRLPDALHMDYMYILSLHKVHKGVLRRNGWIQFPV